MNRLVLSAACSAALFLASGCGDDQATDAGQGPFVAESLAVEAAGPLSVGQSVQLRAVGIDAKGNRREMTEGVTFVSSDERVATVDASGLATVHKRGAVSFTANVGQLEGKLEPATESIECKYPNSAAELQYGRIMPPLAWPAKWPDGTDLQFDLKKVYCELDWAETKTIAFVVSAGWCTPCTLYAQRLENEVAKLESLGMQVFIIEAQDYDYLPADLEFAYKHVDRITDTIPGIVAGDEDTLRNTPSGTLEPVSLFLQKSAIVRAFPSVFVVRTRDMRIIADQNRADFYLPLDKIAADPDADWSKSGNPVFENRCGAGDEESSEPNDTAASAAPLSPGVHEGGICADGPDLYQIDLTGTWTVKLEFEQSVGDLDVYVWDTSVEPPQPAQQNGHVIGSATSTSPETFTHTGPAVIAVVPYQHASAPYTLTLTEQ